MSLNQHPTLRANDGTPHPEGGVRPMTAWILGTGFALLIAGGLIALVGPYSSTTWSWQTLGLLVEALGAIVLTSTLGGREMQGHAAGFWRLAGLVFVLMGIASLVLLALFPDVVVLLVFAAVMLLLGFPLLVIGLVRERRTQSRR